MVTITDDATLGPSKYNFILVLNESVLVPVEMATNNRPFSADEEGSFSNLLSLDNYRRG